MSWNFHRFWKLLNSMGSIIIDSHVFLIILWVFNFMDSFMWIRIIFHNLWLRGTHDIQENWATKNINDYIVHDNFSSSLSTEQCFSFPVEVIYPLFWTGLGCQASYKSKKDLQSTRSAWYVHWGGSRTPLDHTWSHDLLQIKMDSLCRHEGGW